MENLNLHYACHKKKSLHDVGSEQKRKILKNYLKK